MNTEFTEIPTCPASRGYVKRKLENLAEQNLSTEQLASARESVLNKSCICHDLAGGTILKYKINGTATPAICCGPNILNFKRIATLEEMAAHIYGRLSLMTNSERPHMFIKELMLYVDYLREEKRKFALKLSGRTPEYFHKFKGNLLAGIEYYRRLACQFIEEQRSRFLEDLQALENELERMLLPDIV